MNIIIIGKGGHAGVVADTIRLANHFKILGQTEETPGCPIVGDPDQLAFIAIGDNSARYRLSQTGYDFRVNIIHPSASIRGLQVVCPTGCYYGANCVVGNNSHVGRFSIINTGVILEHDSSVGNFSHLCPGVVTGGRVKIGSFTTIGLGAMIRDGITIGDNCIIGMGSVVTKDVPDNSTAWGNPARIKNQ